MSSFKRTCTALAGQRPARLTAVAFALAVSGCSADVTRFDTPGFNLTENNDRPGAATPGAPRRPGYDEQPYAQSPQPPPPRAGLTGEPLPPPDRTATLPPPGYDRSRPQPPSAAAPIERRPPPTLRAVASGEMVEVQSGDTLYSLARRHNVPVSQLIEVNNLGANATIKPGQKLALPANAHAPSEPAPGRPAAPRFPVAKAQPTSPQTTPGWDAIHTMKSGESLYGIARQHRVTLEELQRVNGITEPTRVRIGAKLRVPNNGEQAPRTAYNPPPGNDPIAEPPPAGTPSVSPRVLNGGPRKAAIENRANDADPTPPSAEPLASARFRWPARGRLIAGFGKRPDGTHNDGVNLAVPVGTDIIAAEGGRIAYAGSDIQAYGNLILIRHDNGWVSAYAHADKILVQRDEVVRRGQVIAKAGRTGTVDQPQVHFELRQGAKPVDPMPHMER